MKKDNNILYYGVFFAASILAEIFCIIEKINIIGVSIVILIATYLFLDALRNEKSRIEEHREDYFGARLEEIEKVQKAIYVQMKKNTEITKEENSQMQSVHKSGVEQMLESQNRMAKIIVKYTREDFKKAIANNRANTDKVIDYLNQNKDNSNKNLENLIDHFESSMRDIEKELVKIGQSSDNLRLDMRGMSLNTQLVQQMPLPIVQPINTEIKVQEPEPEPLKEESVEATSIEPEDIGEEFGELQQEDMGEISSMLMEASAAEEEPEIAAMFASPELAIEEEPAIMEEAADPNKQLSPEEIAAMFSSIGGNEPIKEEAKPEPAPVPNASESNKQLSADEIAALFASMG